jgi:hypothetical protein
MRSILSSVLLFMAALLAAGQQSVNPNTQINWPMASGPGAPLGGCSQAGQPYTDTATNAQYICNGVSWFALSGGFTNPMTAIGDLIQGGTAGTPTRLAAGIPAGLYLQSQGAGNSLAWAKISASASDQTGQCFLGSGGLVGAYTDSSGIVKTPLLCLGNGPSSFNVPVGATQLQLGINDDSYVDNLGSFTVSVSKNGGTPTSVTVPGTAMPWSPTANPSFTFGDNNGTSPVVAITGLAATDVITVTYVSGTVNIQPSLPAPFTDANGWLTAPPGPACEGGPVGIVKCDGTTVNPTFYMSIGSGSSGTTINPLTANISGGAAPGSTFNGSAPVTFDYHSFGAGGLAAANTWTAPQMFASGSSLPTQLILGYNTGHAPTGTANDAVLAPDTVGNINLNPNNTAFTPLVPLASGFASGHCPQPTLSGGIWTMADTGLPCGSGTGAFSGGLGTSYQDVTEIAAPSDPSSGNDRLYLNSSTHQLSCLTSSGGSCIPSSGGGSTTVIYTSKIAGVTTGVAVAAGSSATGTTDSAGPINTAIAAGNIDLEVDSGFALSTSLVLASNTTIHCTSPQYGFIMQTSANAPVLVNKDQTAPTTASGTGGFLVSNQTDNNIRVIGCVLNGNSVQAVTGSGNPSGTPHTTNPSTGLAVYGVQFASINGLWLEKNEIYDTGEYSIWLTNVSNFHINGNYIHQPQPTVQLKNTDGIDVLGPAINGEVNSNSITSGDDALVFAAEGCGRSGESDCQIPNFKFGWEQHISARDNKFVGATNGVRLLDASELMDDINIENTQGTVCNSTLNAVQDSALNSFGGGNLGRINIPNYKVQTTSPGSGSCDVYGSSSNMAFGLNAQDVEMPGLQYANPTVNWPVMTMPSGQGTMQIFNMSGWDVTTTSSTFSNVVLIDGPINNLKAVNDTWHDTIGTGAFFSGTTAPTTFTCSGFVGRGLGTVWFAGSVNNGDCFAGINALTANTSGGAAPGSTFNGSAPVTFDYHSFGAAPLASPTFTGIPAAPTATGGTSTTQLATTAFVQLAVAGASTGAGIVTYSGPSLSLSGTLFLPIGGGGLSSSTETNVDIDSPAAATIQNFAVQMSAAPGVGNSVVYTWRKNAASTTITCTISGASATSCNDLTHTLTVAQGDLLDIQVVTTGTIVGTPTIVMGTQFGIAASSGVSSVAVTSPLTTTGATGAITLGCPGCGALVNLFTLGSPPTVSGCTISGGKCVVGTTTTTVTISSIPGTYLDLILKMTGTLNTGAAQGITAQFNGDTAGDYSWGEVYGGNGQTPANSGGSGTSASVCYVNGTNGTGAGGGEVDFPNYAGSFAKTFNAHCGAGNTTSWLNVFYSGGWGGTPGNSAINSITLVPQSGFSFAAGFTFTLHATQ